MTISNDCINQYTVSWYFYLFPIIDRWYQNTIEVRKHFSRSICWLTVLNKNYIVHWKTVTLPTCILIAKLFFINEVELVYFFAQKCKIQRNFGKTAFYSAEVVFLVKFSGGYTKSNNLSSQYSLTDDFEKIHLNGLHSVMSRLTRRKHACARV